MVLKVHELEPDGGNPGTTHRSRPHHIAAMLINPQLLMMDAHFYHLPLIHQYSVLIIGALCTIHVLFLA